MPAKFRKVMESLVEVVNKIISLNSILLVVVVHVVFICTALGSSVCFNFLFPLKEKMKTGRKGEVS